MRGSSLSPQLFVLLSSLVEERSGLHYASSEAPIFGEKVAARMSDAGFDSMLDYYYFLRYDPAGGTELGQLVDTLVVGETYMFRETDALRAAVEHVIAPAVQARGRARVWSAGCSTGEEPFTLAMLCAEAGHLANVEIVATDISERSLARARAGKLGIRSLRMLAPHHPAGAPPWMQRLAERYIADSVVAREIVAAIDFQQESLIGPAPERRDLDLILCRNVLIYFRDDVVRAVVDMLSERLRPGGRLLVGTSESLLRFGTVLRCEERSGAFFYVKSGVDA